MFCCCSCCIALIRKKAKIRGGFGSVASAAALSVDGWVTSHNIDCEDLLHPKFGNDDDVTLGAGFVDAQLDEGSEPGDGSCKHGCSNPYRAFCKNSRCINPTCEDVKPHVRMSNQRLFLCVEDFTFRAVQQRQYCGGTLKDAVSGMHAWLEQSTIHATHRVQVP